MANNSDFNEIFENNINPFDESLDKDSLYNIIIAKPVPENLANFLLNIEKNGEVLRKQFITECAEDQNRFDKPIKKKQVINFAGAPKKKKITLGNKVIELRMQRDLFGRLLGISMTNKVDTEKIIVDAQVVVRCSDSNILIIFLVNLDHLNASLKLWIQWGVGNHERLISINDLYQDLCTSLSKALPCFHAITGCDYTPAFFRKEPTLLENQNTKQDDDYDDIDNNGSSDNDDDYEDASVFCDTFTE
ncbi:uncharacterized protein TNCV_3766461 [Trichonephila clavipes]|nr:uncharacterized protein TNCV_3766461 [Trichonephila clavipes]